MYVQRLIHCRNDVTIDFNIYYNNLTPYWNYHQVTPGLHLFNPPKDNIPADT